MPWKYVTSVVDPKLVKYWMTPMFVYGFTRTFRGEYPEPINLYTHRLVFSLLSGVMYASPVGVLKLLETANRAQVKYMNLDPKAYPSIYFDGFIRNRNVLV